MNCSKVLFSASLTHHAAVLPDCHAAYHAHQEGILVPAPQLQESALLVKADYPPKVGSVIYT